MEKKKGIFSGRIAPMIIAVSLLLVVSVAYFASGNSAASMGTDDSSPIIARDSAAQEVLAHTQIKSMISPLGGIELIAQAPEDVLARLRTTQGVPVPANYSVVLGSTEAKILRVVGQYQAIGDVITTGGSNMIVAGVLSESGTPLDYMGFVNPAQFSRVKGGTDRVFLRTNDQDMPKVFYTYMPGDTLPINISLSEGDMNSYTIHDIAGQLYMPIVLGSQEALAMRDEKFFDRPGDIIHGFFGYSVIVVGVAQETGTALDVMHITPLSGAQIGEGVVQR